MTRTAKSTPAGADGQIAPEAAKALVRDGALLVDVRTPEEFLAGHIEGAKNIPLGELAERAGELGGVDQEVVVYCRSGKRSGQARALLEDKGFKKISDLGPMGRW